MKQSSPDKKLDCVAALLAMTNHPNASAGTA